MLLLVKDTATSGNLSNILMSHGNDSVENDNNEKTSIIEGTFSENPIYIYIIYISVSQMHF